MKKISIKKFINYVDERIVDREISIKATVKDYDEKSCIICFGYDLSNPVVVKIPAKDGHKKLFESLKEKFGESILLTGCDPIGYYSAILITTTPLTITFDNLTFKGQKWLKKLHKERMS